MVYQDISNQNSSESNEKFSAPALLDRFFSVLIDYMVLSPFISFAIYIFFKDAILYWRQNPSAPEQDLLMVIVAISVGFSFCVLQALFIYFWQATPGQYFLKIKIQFEGPAHFIFWRALLRQVGFAISPLFLGLPWLAMLGHTEGKAFYDRLAETRVVSLMSSIDTFSFENEPKYWRSLLATLILFVSFLFAGVLCIQYGKIVHRVASFQKLDQEKFFCEELGEIPITARLQTAVAMNLTNQLSDECLDKEADFALWKMKSGQISLAYFAKSLTEPDAESEATYLNQACREEENSSFDDKTFGCQLAHSFSTQKFNQLYAALSNRHGLLAKTFKYELGLILKKKSDTFANFQALQEFDSQRLVKKYLLTEMLKEKSSKSRSPASADDAAEKIFDAKLAEKWMQEL
ncbi:MAG: RDD family protein [Bdellovibrionaceae bacterium]|nr:RDD family protein [Bdellovibrio sp.]